MRREENSEGPSGETPKEQWEWFGHAGHFICGRWCRFHLCTLVGEHLVSTVGEYWPDSDVRKIHARIHDSSWLSDNTHLKGDEFDAAYMKRFGFEEIGLGRTYETMVFAVTGERCELPDCGCGLPTIIPTELDFKGYNNAGDAARGHHEMCTKWADPRAHPKGGDEDE